MREEGRREGERERPRLEYRRACACARANLGSAKRTDASGNYYSIDACAYSNEQERQSVVERECLTTLVCSSPFFSPAAVFTFFPSSLLLRRPLLVSRFAFVIFIVPRGRSLTIGSPDRVEPRRFCVPSIAEIARERFLPLYILKKETVSTN